MMILQKTQLPEELLTLVIPVYNREKIVMRTLESIEKQKFYPPIILVDNNSTDGTYTVLEQWVKHHPEIPATLLREERKGATNARNCGLAYVKTPWVMFFDSDDSMSPEHLSRIGDALNLYNRTDVKIIGWDTLMDFEGGGKKLGLFRTDHPVFYSLFEGAMATQRWIARTSLVREVGGWNPDVELWDDIDLGLRMLSSHPRMIKLPGKPTVDVFVTRNSITRMCYYDQEHRLEHTVSYFKKTLQDKPELKYIPLLKSIYAAHYYREGHREESQRLLKEALNEASSQMRLMLTFAYHYTRLGGRGIARILRRFISVKS